jgi:hypothetical protein
MPSWTATRDGSVEAATASRWPRTAAPAPNRSQFLARAPQRPSSRRDLPPMVYDLDLTVMVTAAGIAALAAVYLWSKDPGRRCRAWRLLKLLLLRKP